ncbi:MAG: NUDIX hydrolase [Candidatus Caenarcaniphilales bacterium]|nr:NUDIX hydrolase [Candidatus Caenarcaniphilales bacterium]
MTEIIPEKRLDSVLIHDGEILKLKLDQVLLPNGHTANREVVIHPGGVVIIPFTPEGKFVLVKQFRYPVGEVLWEFPAGRLNPGEEPRLAAERELKEETGFQGGELKDLGKIYTAPGFCDEILYFYLATEIQPGEARPDHDEFVEALTFTSQEVEDYIHAAMIKDAKTIVGFLKAKEALSKNF